MAHFTNFSDFNPGDEYSPDGFLDNADFDRDDWDLSTNEDADLDLDDDSWSQVGIDDLDFDDLDDLEEDSDDFQGVF